MTTNRPPHNKITRYIKKLQGNLAAYMATVRTIPHYRRKIALCIFHGIWMVFLTLVLQYITLTRSDEAGFLRKAAIWKHNILNLDKKPGEGQFVFIDMSKDPETIEDPELAYDGNDSLKGAQIVIRDRRKLAYFLRELNHHPGAYTFVLCDILFQDPSPDDSLLGPELKKARRLLCTKIYG